uniref:Uncharacterized protein n=1 Tax=Sphaerodactylus townsendi TaxID=933632 RepID=A0ACB8EVR4_9SAUR
MASQLGYSVGEDAGIHCETSFSRNGVSLEPFKKYRIQPVNPDKVTFVIVNVSKEDGGIYTSYAVDRNTWFRSEQSDLVELLIKDTDLPKPSISMSPGWVEFLGSNITIQCRARGPVKRFYLHRFGYPYAGLPRMIETDGDVADFLFIDVSWDQLGEYFCTYRPPWGFLMSMPSNTVALQLLGGSYSSDDAFEASS